MTYTRRALSIAFAAITLTFGLLLGQAADSQAQMPAQPVPGQTYEIEIPQAEWDAARARGPIRPWPGRTFTAEYLGIRCNEVGCFPAWVLSNGVYGHVPAHWVRG